MSPSNMAQAAEPEIVIIESTDLATIIERFDVAPANQAEAIQVVIEHVSRIWKTDACFVAALVLRSREEQGGLSVYSQWKRSTIDAPESSPSDARSLRSAMAGFKLLDSRSYTVEFTRQAPPMTEPTRFSMTTTPNAHFGIFGVTSDNQDALLNLARDHAPESLGSAGLLAIDFHKSLDGRQVVNLGAWSALDRFDELLTRPGFKDKDEYYKGIADFKHDFFDVVCIEVSSVR